jgi:hypothetical protein
MKTVLVLVAVVVMASAAAWAGCGSCPGDKPADNKAAVAGAACTAGDTVYVCAACKMCDVKAGTCTKCAAELKAMHVLTVKDGVVTLCPCEAGCQCTVKADDATQCSCGKPVVTLQCGQAGQKSGACGPAK